jgi:hypothetical protein
VKRILVLPLVVGILGLAAIGPAPAQQADYLPPPPPPPPDYVPPPPDYAPTQPPPDYAPPPGYDSSAYPPPDGAYADSDQDYVPPPPDPVVSVYVDPPTEEPEPIGVPWAPPPMLVEDPGPPPYFGAVWTGGYWVWGGRWLWAHGRWLGAPMAGYAWTQPYYENRDGVVIFVPGYWRAPGLVFVAPAMGISILMVTAAPGVVMGPPPRGPNCIFVPPPPGSRLGIVVPAPLGTSPAVVIGAPPVVRFGMQVRLGDEGHVRIEAPATATASGRAVTVMAPREAHLAAAQRPIVRVAAPVPASSNAIRGFNPRGPLPTLPRAVAVKPVIAAPEQLHRAARADRAAPAASPDRPRGNAPQPNRVERVPQSRPEQPPPAAHPKDPRPERGASQIERRDQPAQRPAPPAERPAQKSEGARAPQGSEPARAPQGAEGARAPEGNPGGEHPPAPAQKKAEEARPKGEHEERERR